MTPCYNEESNVYEIYTRVRNVLKKYPKYRYEHIFIDNASKDSTVDKIKEIAKTDKNVKLIVNSRNFGYIRSPYYGLLQCQGDASIYIVADLQEPPEIIEDFINKWENGYKIVIGIKNKSEENPLIFLLRKLYYKIVRKMTDEFELIQNFTGFGLYDKKIIDTLRQIEDPYPYFRGLICELGFEKSFVNFTQPKRKKGKSYSNFYRLYDLAMLGFVSYSRLPLRIFLFFGYFSAFISLIVGIIYLVYKIMRWYSFDAGIAPLVIGFFFFSSIQIIFIGILGEYVGTILTQVKKRPLVVEKERINFEKTRPKK